MQYRVGDTLEQWIYKMRLDDPRNRKKNLDMLFRLHPEYMKRYDYKEEDYPNKTGRIAICSIIKDEQAYLEEWLQHHIKLGFTDIFLYEDYGSKSHKDITDKYKEVHLEMFQNVSVLNLGDMKTCKKQVELFTWFCNEYKGKLDWCLFSDPDEYLMFDEGCGLKDICREGYRGTMLLWKIYGCSGHIKKPIGSVVESYTEVEDTPERNGKVMVNMRYKDSCWYNPHRLLFATSVSLKDDYRGMNYTIAWLNHYVTHSWEEWVNQVLERGDVTTYKPRTLWQFFRFNNTMLPIAEQLISPHISLHKDIIGHKEVFNNIKHCWE